MSSAQEEAEEDEEDFTQSSVESFVFVMLLVINSQLSLSLWAFVVIH